MKTHNRLLRKTALAAAVVLLVGGVPTMEGSMIEGSGYVFISSAYAGDDGGGKAGGQKGAMGEGRGGQGAKGAGEAGYRGGKAVQDLLAEDDDGDDSDRPDWAGVPGGEDRPGDDKGSGGNTEPGTTKGDIYGDMILLVRNPITGEPVTTADGWTLACTDLACTPELAVEMVDGELPAGTTTFEVDLGRGSIARAPSTVLDGRLDEALSLLTSADSITQDEAGRLVVTVDGVTKTIDSPLENLALYVDLMAGLTTWQVSPTEAALAASGLANLSTAASLLGAAADKTGDVTLDYYMYENVITGLVAPDSYYNLSSFWYVRNYDATYDFWYSPDGLVAPVAATMDIDDYLQYVNGTLPPSFEKAALFAAAADDAIEVIELLHTQIVTDDFLNGYDGYVIK